MVRLAAHYCRTKNVFHNQNETAETIIKTAQLKIMFIVYLSRHTMHVLWT